MSTFPYVVMTIMLIRGVTLEGASTGIEFYIEPKTDGLTEPDVSQNWLIAMSRDWDGYYTYIHTVIMLHPIEVTL